MKVAKSKKPVAVCISDIHFNLNTLSVASQALAEARRAAESLGVPLIIDGDLNDTKDIIRAKVANAIIAILQGAKVQVFIVEGNHDKINEKGAEHGLNYLRPYAIVVDDVTVYPDILPGVRFIPYFSDRAALEQVIREKCQPGEILVMHQGVSGAAMGDYVVDKTSIDHALLKDFICISGHYHRHQTVGTVTYIGSPYTISFGEANDGLKGFLILYSDGSFTREILDLRRHVIIETDTQTLFGADESAPLPFGLPRPDDLIWLKVKGPYTELEKLRKRDVGAKLFGHSNFKLDKIYTDAAKLESKTETMSPGAIMDAVIEGTHETPKQKELLKSLWREVLA